MLKALKWLFSSKKRTAAVVAVLFAALSPLLNKVGIDVTTEQVALIVGALSAFVLGQGLEDMGKAAAELEDGDD